MRRSDRILVWAFATLTATTPAAVFALALLRAPGWAMFAVVVALFATIWVGAFLTVPSGRRKEGDTE